MAKVATPETSGEEPSVFALVMSRNVTVPVGVPKRAKYDTVAVNVTELPNVEGFALVVKVVVVEPIHNAMVLTSWSSTPKKA